MKVKFALFNIDTACVDVYVNEYAKKPKVSIYTPLVEESLQMSTYTQSQVDKLIYDNPLEYAEMVLNGTLADYVALCNKSGYEQTKHLKTQIQAHNEGMSETQAESLARQYLMYDS